MRRYCCKIPRAGPAIICFYNVDRTLRGCHWSKTHVLSEYKTWKKRVLLFFATLLLYHKANEEA